MRLARKLQLAYLSLLLIPMLTMGILILTTFYTGSHSLGPYADLEAPGWIKVELAAIFEEDWEAYGKLKEPVVIFLMDSGGYMKFPHVTTRDALPENYPYLGSLDQRVAAEEGRVLSGSGPIMLTEVLERFGTEWTLDISMTPISVGEDKYLAGWRYPRHGLPGFIARKGWLFPLIFLTGIMLIPALLDARLRKSIKNLQSAVQRLSSGNLDEPIPVRKKDDLKDLAATLDNTRIELKESRDQKARFLMAVSHDLRTPLTSIKGYVEALDDGIPESSEDYQHFLSVLMSKTSLLENRIGELIDFASSGRGGWKKPEASVGADKLIGRLDTAFRQDCGFSGRAYSSSIAVPAGIVVDGDSEILYRAWENLFSNATRHTSRDESIRFCAGVETGDSVETWEGPGISKSSMLLFGEIADTGEGVPDDFVPLLFEAFSRGDSGRNAAGLGLGLASVKAVAEAHGGSVSYRPGEGGGSIFRVEIPCRYESGSGTN